MNAPKPYWNPYVAGVALGLVALASFIVTGRGLGASGAFKHAGAALIHQADPTWAEEHQNIGPLFQPGRSVMNNWIVFVVLGVAVGGGVGAWTGRRFKVEVVTGPRIAAANRIVLAGLGGFLSGFAAQLARGCTSGQAVTGGAQLALGSWVFMFAVFGGAYGLAYFVRKQWI
jgi:hypothetical protein